MGVWREGLRPSARSNGGVASTYVIFAATFSRGVTCIYQATSRDYSASRSR